MEPLHRSEQIQIARLTEHILYCNWTGPQTKQSIINCGETILTTLKANQFTRVLNDNTQVTGPWHTAVQWAAEEWFPDMVNAGLQRFAWIISPDIFARVSAKRARPRIKEIKTFTNYQEAYNWLTAK